MQDKPYYLELEKYLKPENEKEIEEGLYLKLKGSPEELNYTNINYLKMKDLNYFILNKLDLKNNLKYYIFKNNLLKKFFEKKRMFFIDLYSKWE